MFQSLSGFWLGFCTVSRNRSERSENEVSIPFRVLVGFLQGYVVAFREELNRFQSLSGF